MRLLPWEAGWLPTWFTQKLAKARDCGADQSKTILTCIDPAGLMFCTAISSAEDLVPGCTCRSGIGPLEVATCITPHGMGEAVEATKSRLLRLTIVDQSLRLVRLQNSV